jgi:hypothetical protein
MVDTFRKKSVLIAVFCSLTLFIALPISSGYGISMQGATPITNGITNEQMTTTEYAYYKICCSMGDNLSVTLTYYGGGTDLDLVIFNRSGSILDSSYHSSSDDSCSVICSSSGYYYIDVINYANIVPSTINLIVSGATGSGCTSYRIPGFEIIITLVGLIAATFLGLILLKSRKVILQ